MNLKSQRIWCYACNGEVFMEPLLDSNNTNYDYSSTMCSPDSTLKNSDSLNTTETAGGNVHPQDQKISNVGSGCSS